MAHAHQFKLMRQGGCFLSTLFESTNTEQHFSRAADAAGNPLQKRAVVGSPDLGRACTGRDARLQAQSKTS